MPKANQAVSKALAYLAQSQREDGAWPGQASKHADDFSKIRKQPTIFATSLILNSLATVPESLALRDRAKDYLLAQRSPEWTWNYWERNSAAAKREPYPDDLDDTACSLAALYRHQPSLVDGSVQAAIANMLIACENAPGGPYQTWIVNLQQHPKWADTDLAVNANIAYLLKQLGIELEGLTGFIETAIRQQKLTSLYYEGIAPLLYFIARYYSGQLLPELQQLIRAELRKSHNPLTLALLVCAARYSHVTGPQIDTARQQLLSCQQADGSWPGYALYRDPHVQGALYYAGSAALTTAFAIEALHSAVSSKPRQQGGLPAWALRQINQLGSSKITNSYRQQLEQLFASDHDSQITNISGITAQAVGKTVPLRISRALNLASCNGWLAYTIYDNFLDNEGDPATLPIANIAMRTMVEQFSTALPDPAFTNLVKQTLFTVDAANAWETSLARVTPGNQLYIEKLPGYSNYHQLAERSLGHKLAAQGTLLALGYGLRSRQQHLLSQFFEHYIIARQLNDDAHDWEQDLRLGQLSAVVCKLLAGYKPLPYRLDLDKEIDDLRLHFWQHTIEEIHRDIHQHLQASRQLLSQLQFADSSEFESWLNRLGDAADEALQKRAEAEAFIAGFGA